MTVCHLRTPMKPRDTETAGFRLPPENGNVAYTMTISMQPIAVALQVALQGDSAQHPTANAMTNVPTNSAMKGAAAAAQDRFCDSTENVLELLLMVP
eukprot:CAMPEP_0168457546 /NCGR_PEP_ID=MMETSP0228-20121227/51892_1 /TAXON_ID=133427 /ORGANISM="Protoceratium reticulatum, Strain CCCM 535 (=CCMP 1889)" /LENGTH=96 /DNA_ID=CAMNT_0008472567 /DNA_START=208 /DNA_END=498 /DNA_ORIENTATION=+